MTEEIEEEKEEGEEDKKKLAMLLVYWIEHNLSLIHI